MAKARGSTSAASLREFGEKGQSTVEFAVVTSAFLTVMIALGLLWRTFGNGLVVTHALAVASHHIQDVAAATLTDIFLY